MENNPQPSLPPEGHHHHFHIFWPLLLIAVGIFLFLNSTHMLPGTVLDTLLKLWPLLLVIAGLDSFLNRGGFVGSVLLVGLGGIFLLANFGYIQVSVWNVILRMWPVLLIAWGLDLLIGRRRTVFSWLAGIVIGLALVGGIFWFATTYSTNQAPRVETFNQPLVSAKSGNGSISMTAGTLKLSGGAAATNILEAKLGLHNSQNFSQSSGVQNGVNDFSLQDESNNTVYPFDVTNYLWDIKLNSKVPLNLNSDLTTGIMTVDFSGMEIASFNLKIAAGQIDLTLPVSGSYNGIVEGAASIIKIHLPQNSKLCLQTSMAVSLLSLPAGFNRTIDCGKTGVPNLEIKNAVGAVSVEYSK